MTMLRRALAIAVATPSLLAAQARVAGSTYTIDQFLSPPSPLEVSAARKADKLAWVTYEKGMRNIHVASAPSFAAKRITNFMNDDGVDVGSVRLSDDGSMAIFVRGHGQNRDGWVANPSHDPNGAERAVWAAKTDGSGAWRLASIMNEQAGGRGGGSPELSPDGRYAVFARDGQIYRAATARGAKSAMDTAGVPFIKAWGRQSAPAWSPDGSKLAFVSTRENHGFIGVYDMKTRRVDFLAPSTDFDNSPTWSPDGKRIAFIRRPGTPFGQQVATGGAFGQAPAPAAGAPAGRGAGRGGDAPPPSGCRAAPDGGGRGGFANQNDTTPPQPADGLCRAAFAGGYTLYRRPIRAESRCLWRATGRSIFTVRPIWDGRRARWAAWTFTGSREITSVWLRRPLSGISLSSCAAVSRGLMRKGTTLRGHTVLSSDVTVAVVPRERFSATERSLSNLFEQTTSPFKLVYVSAGAPRSVQRYLENAADQKKFRLITTDRHLSPNQARNLALGDISTKYVAVLDNDALVTPGWIERLVRCADETGAWLVGPLSLIGEIEEQRIHSAGGTLQFNHRDGQRILYTDQGLSDVPLASLTEPLRRHACDFLEFHCLLMRTEAFDRLLPLDEQLLSLDEHVDVSLTARAAGGGVYLEPASVATYVVPPPFEWSDLPYFMLRWSDDWAEATVRHFNRKWGVAATRQFDDDDPDLRQEDTAVRWMRAHRRLATGLEVRVDWDDQLESAVEQARVMVALFQSVDRDRFDLGLSTAEDVQVEAVQGLTPAETLERLPALLARAGTDRLNVLFRPGPPGRPGQPALVRVDLNHQTLGRVEPQGFLTLQTGSDRYHLWLAVDQRSWRSGSVLRRLTASAAPGGSGGFSRVAGSLVLDTADQSATGPARATLRRGATGIVTTGMDLESSGALEHLWSARMY